MSDEFILHHIEKKILSCKHYQLVLPFVQMNTPSFLLQCDTHYAAHFDYILQILKGSQMLFNIGTQNIKLKTFFLDQ